jgi:hypothetical protein
VSLTVCLVPTGTLSYPEGGGGGHLWAYLNWALGFQAAGCRVIWLEYLTTDPSPNTLEANWRRLAQRLGEAGLDTTVALTSAPGVRLPGRLDEAWLDLDAAAEADLLVNFLYALGPAAVQRFKRSALIDIDPGLLQGWMTRGELDVAAHDIHFTIGERVGATALAGQRAAVEWHHTAPPVALDAWSVRPAAPDAPYTTVSHWWDDKNWISWDGGLCANDKRTAFLEYRELPRRTAVPLELALFLSPSDEDEKQSLEQHGWRIRLANEVSAGPREYSAYIGASRGEFSCAKPGYVRLENAWISDRTLCYLASGKPAVVQYTGPSRYLPEAEGALRFRSLEEAARRLEQSERDYHAHGRAARALAEEFFDARRVAAGILERTLA